jgi:hypothetical protein
MPSSSDASATPARLCPIASGVAVVYLVVVVLAWYSHRGSVFGTQVTVAPLYCLGAALWWGTLRFTRGLRLQDLGREGLVIAFSSLGLFGILWYFGRRGSYPLDLPTNPNDLERLLPFFYFSFSCVVMRMVFPLLIARNWLGTTSADYGYRIRGMSRVAWIYAVLLLAAVPMVWFASKRPDFIHKYPLCRTAIEDGALVLTTFVVYELAYLMIFVSGESFWRGYILFGLHRRLGLNALFFMLFPYVLSHLGKPMFETLGAIAAGLLLGGLALAHGSFWLGVALHFGVALMMDLFALVERGVTLVGGGS